MTRVIQSSILTGQGHSSNEHKQNKTEFYRNHTCCVPLSQMEVSRGYFKTCIDSLQAPTVFRQIQVTYTHTPLGRTPNFHSNTSHSLQIWSLLQKIINSLLPYRMCRLTSSYWTLWALILLSKLYIIIQFLPHGKQNLWLL
jgi:hypothetical protein